MDNMNNENNQFNEQQNVNDQQNVYGQQYGYEQNGQPVYGQVQGQKGTGKGMGIASLVLGIVSLLLFCSCINYITAILAIVFGIIQIVKNEQKVLAIVGIVCAVLSMIGGIIFFYAVGASSMNLMQNYMVDGEFDVDSYMEDIYGDL